MPPYRALYCRLAPIFCFVLWVTRDWNSLPEKVVESTSPNQFKSGLAKHFQAEQLFTIGDVDHLTTILIIWYTCLSHLPEHPDIQAWIETGFTSIALSSQEMCAPYFLLQTSSSYKKRAKKIS